MATTVTGLEIRQALSEQVGDWVYLGEATGAGTVSYIDDTERLKGNNLPSSLFDNAIVRIASGTRQGESAYVDEVDFVNGRLYVTPDFTGALSSGDDYEIWLRGIDPDMVDRLRDDALARFCSTWRPNPVCELPDGDLETAGVTNWVVVAGATRTKSLTSFPDIPGRWQLAVVHTTAATDWIESAALNVQPGERWFLEVPVSAYVTATDAAATASIEVADVTNTSTVPLGGIVSSHTGKGWGKISLLFTVPAGCYKILLRLKSATAASTTVWGPFCMFRRDKSEIALPDRITTKKRVATSFGRTDVNPATSEVRASQFTIRETRNVERFQVGNHVLLRFNPPTSDSAIFYWERGYFARLQTTYFTIAGRIVGDAASTDCPKEYIVASLAERVAKYMLDMTGEAEWQAAWVRASAELNYWENEMAAEPRFVEENESPVYIPQLTV